MARTARSVALDVLERVLGRAQPLDEIFAGHPHLAALSPRDRAFARLLVATTLRRLGQIDAVIATFVERPPRSERVLGLLRLGLAQLLFLETPAHAAVGETVALATGREAHARGLVNAVLRRAAREGASLDAGQDEASLNVPAWLLATWRQAYGPEVAGRIVAVQLQEPPLDLTVRGEPAAAALGLGGTHLFAQTVRRAGRGTIEDLPGYEEGDFWVQDAAATLPALLLGDVQGRAVIDLCAAPGGKTAQLAAAGARVTAVELSAKRADRLRQNLARLRLDAEVVVADARAWRPEQPADAVLLDAPCTATGTIRRHPDVTWHKTPADVVRMSGLQGELLRAGCTMLKPGGTLVYASCSLQPEEGPAVIAPALLEGLAVERAPVARPELQGLPVDLTDEGEVRTLPCHLADQGGLDGFFITRLRRVGSEGAI